MEHTPCVSSNELFDGTFLTLVTEIITQQENLRRSNLRGITGQTLWPRTYSRLYFMLNYEKIKFIRLNIRNSKNIFVFSIALKQEELWLETFQNLILREIYFSSTWIMYPIFMRMLWRAQRNVWHGAMYSYSIHGPCKCSVIRMNLENVFRQNNMKHLGAGLDFMETNQAICKDNNRIFFITDLFPILIVNL